MKRGNTADLLMIGHFKSEQPTHVAPLQPKLLSDGAERVMGVINAAIVHFFQELFT
ncbi:hypothetical protein [Caballeronia glebae]|uniref:hypothetical protein n=1 Tax=Caballeronia glebae TaxID=1777143 RepID=UPI0038BAF00E